MIPLPGGAVGPKGSKPRAPQKFLEMARKEMEASKSLRELLPELEHADPERE